MRTTSSVSKRNRKLLPIPGVLILVVVFLAGIGVVRYFGAEARIQRATFRLIQTVEKTGEESPVALGLAANRFGDALATNMVLILEGTGILTASRQETVQLFAQVRNSVDQMTFTDPVLSVRQEKSGAVIARVTAQYYFATGTTGEGERGEGKAMLTWVNGKDGWQIVQAILQEEEGVAVLKGWK